MAIAPVTGNTRLVGVSTPDDIVQRTFTNAVSTGSLLVAVYECITNDALTFADNVNGAWTAGPSVYSSALGALIGCAYFPGSASASAGTLQVTGTGATATQNKGLVITEYSGALTSSPVDGTSVSNQSSGTSAINAGTITTTQAGIVIGAAIYTATSPDPTPNANFSGTVSTITGGYPIAIEEWITSTGQAAAVDWSSKDFWAAIGIAFKATGGGGGPAWVPTMLLRGVG